MVRESIDRSSLPVLSHLCLRLFTRICKGVFCFDYNTGAREPKFPTEPRVLESCVLSVVVGMVMLE